MKPAYIAKVAQPALLIIPIFPFKEKDKQTVIYGSVLLLLLSVKRPNQGCWRVEVADDRGKTGLGSVAG